MSARSPRGWLELLARLGPGDLRRISRLVDQLVTAPAAAKETANVMLDAPPVPATAEEARARCDAVNTYLAEAISRQKHERWLERSRRTWCT